MKAPKKFGGRPRREPKPGERVHLGFRVTPELKARIEHAAQVSGRSLSQESEFRLELSFQREDLLEDALKLAYGREISGILLFLGHVMETVIGVAGVMREGEDFSRIDWDFVRNAREIWASDPVLFANVMQAADAVIGALRRAHPEEMPRINEDHGINLALSALRGVADPTGTGLAAGEYHRIRTLLGPIADRLKELIYEGTYPAPREAELADKARRRG